MRALPEAERDGTLLSRVNTRSGGHAPEAASEETRGPVSLGSELPIEAGALDGAHAGHEHLNFLCAQVLRSTRFLIGRLPGGAA